MIPHNRPSTNASDYKALKKSVESGLLSKGPEVEKFEDDFCAYMGLPNGHAVAVNSGSAALYLALWVLNAEGKKIATPVYTCSAIRNAIGLIRGKPLWIDNKKDSCNIDLDAVIKSPAKIAILPHMFGFPMDLSKITRSIDVIEDCAQALGAKINNNPVGLQGRLGIFSFSATKMITSAGQGGMIISKDIQLINKIKDCLNFDCRKDDNLRFNFKMGELNAAFGRNQLKRLDQFIKARDKIFSNYKDRFYMQEEKVKNSSPVRYRAIVRTQRPELIQLFFSLNKIHTIIPIYDWELLSQNERRFPNAFAFSRSTVSLPIYPTLRRLKYGNTRGR